MTNPGTILLSKITFDILYNILSDILELRKNGIYKYHYLEMYDDKKDELITRLGDPKIDIKSIKERNLNKQDFYNKESENIFEAKNGLLYSYPTDIDALSKTQILNKLFELDVAEVESNITELDIQIESKETKVETVTTEYNEDRIYGTIEYELIYGEKTKEIILNSLLETFNQETQYSFTKFHEILMTNYKEYGRGDGILTIDTYKDISYKGIYSALLYFLYTGKIQSFKFNNEGFDIELSDSDGKEYNVIDKDNLNLGIVNGVIKNNGIPIVNFTNTERKIIKQIWSKNKEGGISIENLLNQTKQTEGALKQSVKMMKKKFKEQGFNNDIIKIQLKKEGCTIQLYSTNKGKS